MLWVTRHRPHSDRCASIWLIKNFIDSDAVFDFVSREAEIAEGAIAFVLPKAKLNPTEQETTFELLMRHYSINDPAVKRIASLIHDFEIEAKEDTSKLKYPDAAGFFKIVRGLDRTSKTDSEIVHKAMIVVDALYAQLKAENCTEPDTMQ